MAGRALICAGAAAVALLAGASSASGAVTIGSDLTQIGGGSSAPCSATAQGGPCTLVNTQAANPVTSPIDGVVVRWRLYVQEASPIDRLRIVRVNGNDITLIRSAPLPNPPPASFVLNVMPLAPGVPISAGDSIGYDTTGNANVVNPRPGTSYLLTKPLPPDGATQTGTPNANAEIPFNADIEPDCDGDLLGDETQDASVDCESPDTQITGGPKDKTKKKRATFEFSSTEPGSSFQCSLDGAAFAPCSSPDQVKVKKGKHTFAVRAIDPAGNIDASAATDDWKVKKKKRR
jgi:hypothetical protein